MLLTPDYVGIVKRKSKTMFECKLEARGYELDSYGHINNAVYLNYLEQARWELFQKSGLLDLFRNKDYKLVVTEIIIKYKHEIRQFDKLCVLTQVIHEPPYLIFNQTIRNETSQQTASKAVVKTVLLDNENMPCDIPSIIINSLLT